MTTETYELWGGHARVNLPKGYLNASEIRPVPDHQEIFVNNDSRDTDCQNSMVISLCEAVTYGTKTSYEAFMYHIIDQLDDDGPCMAMLETVPRTMPNFQGAPVLITSTMTKPTKLENGLYAFVVQLFLLLRIESKETDVLVTVNIPKAVGGSASLAKDPILDPDDRNLSLGKHMMEDFAESFQIVDWSFLG